MKTFFVDGTSQPLFLYLISIPQFISPFRPLLSTRVVYPWGESLPFPVRKPTSINIRNFIKIPKSGSKKKYSATYQDFFG